MTEFPKVRTPFLQKVGGKDKQLLLETIADQVAFGDTTVDDELRRLRTLITGGTEAKVYASYADMIADDTVEVGTIARVIDASAGGDVESGGASYLWDGAEWKFLGSTNIDTILPKWEDIQNKPTSPVNDIDDTVGKRHVHDNKEDVLDKLSVNENGKLTLNDQPVSAVNPEDVRNVVDDVVTGKLPEVAEQVKQEVLETTELRDVLYLDYLPPTKPANLRDGGIIIVGDGPIA